MKKIFLGMLLPGALFAFRTSIAQSKFYRVNQLEVDRAKATLGKECRAYASSADIPEKKNKADQKLIALLNEFYNNHLSVDEITQKLEPFAGKKWSYITTNLGGAVKYETPVRSEGNLKASISFTLFQNEVVYKKIYFETVTKTKCIGSGGAFIDPVDVNYLDVFCLASIDFPISFRVQTGIIACEATSYESLKGYTASGYKLASVDSLYINTMVWYDDDKYSMKKVDPRLLTVTNFHNTYILYQLLYSPNQVVAIYSFEALTYLQAAGVAKHPDYIRQKMEEIQNSPIKFALQEGDTVRNGSTYKELQVSTEKIVAKYKEGLRQLQ